jgi:hypothetical protein
MMMMMMKEEGALIDGVEQERTEDCLDETITCGLEALASLGKQPRALSIR